MRGLLRLLPVAALAVLLVPGAAPSPVGADAHIVAANNGYLLPEVVVDVAGTLWFTNVDLPLHDVVAVADGPETNPWCDRFTTRACPLFASPLIGTAEQAPVSGIEQLPPLTSSDYYCSIHPWMKGTITTI